MEAVIFCGAQASGKSTFFKEHFFWTHVLISLDVLRTRKREELFLQTALAARQRFVVDNTNPLKEERRKYIEAAKSHHFKVIGYYFISAYEELAARNGQRSGKARVPEAAIKATLAKMEKPSYTEGFDQLFQVSILDDKFVINELPK